MKIKMFYNRSGPEFVEKSIQAWLNENSNINIIRILQSQSGRHDINLVVSIWYEDLS